MLRTIWLILYYGVLIYLPSSNSRICGKLCKSLRGGACRFIFKKCGRNINGERGARFGSGRNIEIGDNSGLGINADVPNNLIIGNNVMMGKNVTILHSNHNFARKDIPMREQGFTPMQQTVIGDDVWIGHNVIMTSGKEGRVVETGTIIGAGCVLTKNFPPYSIVGGNPSKLIRQR